MLFANEQKKIELSVGLQNLLSKEMLSVKNGMDDILQGIISSDFQKIQTIAKKIENSYILKQQLTLPQQQEIKEKLSTQFIKLDSSFHESASELSNVAEFEDLNGTIEIYSDMINQCVKCHQIYARDRFTKFE
jgi:hypothetical protein